MITTKTVLVLGAGASEPYKFPLGRELVKRVCDFAGSPGAEEWCKGMRDHLYNAHSADVGYWNTLLSRIRGLGTELGIARPGSIDEFLERRPDIADAGKLVIAKILLDAEQASKHHLYGDRTKGHWYDFLRSRLVSSPEDFGQNRLRIITFNYERSLEHYLFESLWPYYRIDIEKEEYAGMMNQIGVIHIYGSLGPLPWQSKAHTVRYGTKAHEEIWEAGKSIRILHEGTGDEVEENLSKAREWLEWADRILFLGFGFHPDNVARLRLNEKLRMDRMIQATCRGLALTNKDAAELCTPWAHRGIGPIPAVEFPDSEADCYTFLHDFVVLS